MIKYTVVSSVDSQSASMCDYASNIGKIEEACVVKVFPHGLHCQIEGLSDLCFLPHSQLELNGFNGSSIQALFCVGDKINVQIIARQKNNKYWLVSSRSADAHLQWISKGPTVGEKCQATVSRVIPPFGAFLVLPNGIPAFSSISTNPNLWEFLYGTGRLENGANIRVKVVDWDRLGRGVRVDIDFGNPEKLDIVKIHEAKVSYVTQRFRKKKKCEVIHQILYADLKTGEVAHVYVNQYLFPEKLFSVKSVIKIQIAETSRRRFYLPIIRSELINGPKLTENVFEVGRVLLARILETSERFAICIIEDGVLGLIHHSTIIRESDFDARKYIHPGDWVRVRVLELSLSRNIPWQDNSLRDTKASKNQPFYQLEFVALNEAADDSFDRNPLIDLLAVRAEGKSGGFRRNKEFRQSVLEAYSFTCCICGQRYCVGSSSAMEAAHIIPKGKRGSDIISNSLCFCPVHHWAFDRGFISIDSDCLIEVSNELLRLTAEASWLADYNGKKAHIQDEMRPDPNALNWHRENVFIK